mmetsp:Transcript_29175/g.49255  ORF Transcript_29175/g.49255 Transcript_29175/m.49255 type:complete len:308 (+) Transcript_29175:64-987(+)
MGNLSSSIQHVALLGDSTIDNGGWTGGGPCVHDQVRSLLPQTTLCARDGALMAAISTQAARAPQDTSHFVVSIGGNDGIGGINIMTQRASSVGDGVEALYSFAKEFEAEYTQTIENLIQQVGTKKQIVLCSIYNPCFGPLGVTTLSQAAANACVAVLADAILRVATRLGLPVIDWRRVMTKVEDFANPIEPSSLGGQKMAATVVDVLRTHPFGSRQTIVYPRNYPKTEIGEQAVEGLVPHDQSLGEYKTQSEDSSVIKGDRERSDLNSDGGEVKSASGGRGTMPVENVLDEPSSAAIVQGIRESSQK